MNDVVIWRGQKIIADHLIVELRSHEDLNLATQVADSVGMRVVGYMSDVKFWTFSFPGVGSAEKIEKAYKALKAHPEILNVDPDYVASGR